MTLPLKKIMLTCLILGLSGSTAYGTSHKQQIQTLANRMKTSRQSLGTLLKSNPSMEQRLRRVGRYYHQGISTAPKNWRLNPNIRNIVSSRIETEKNMASSRGVGRVNIYEPLRRIVDSKRRTIGYVLETLWSPTPSPYKKTDSLYGKPHYGLRTFYDKQGKFVSYHFWKE